MDMQIRDLDQTGSGVLRRDTLPHGPRPDFLDGLLARIHRMLNPERRSAARPTEVAVTERRR
jgi:hypothetical protein